MYCSKCGAQLSPNAAFCGACGNPVYAGNTQYDIYKYSYEYARENRAWVSFGGMFWRGMAYCLAPLLLMFFGTELAVAAIILSMAGIAVLITECCIRRKYMLARQSAVVIDKECGTAYYVMLVGETSTGFDTATRAIAAAQNIKNANEQAMLSQLDHVLIQEVRRFQNGENRYNIWTGGDVRVRELNQVSLVKESKRCCTYRYFTKKGNQKKLKLPKCFPGANEALIR